MVKGQYHRADGPTRGAGICVSWRFASETAAALVVEAADLLAAAKDKMRVNAEKYPVMPARSASGKYTEL